MDRGTSRGTSERHATRSADAPLAGHDDTPTTVTRPWAPLGEQHRGRQAERHRDERVTDGGRPDGVDGGRADGVDGGRADGVDGGRTHAQDGGRPGGARSEKHGGVGEQVGGLFVVRVIKRYAAANGGTMAINIAWNALFAFFPIILLITTTLTAIFGSSDVSATIDTNIQSAVPGTQGAEIVQALHSFHQASGVLFVLSIVGLVWSGTSLFGAIDQGLNALWPEKQRSFVRQKLMGVFMIAVFTVLVALDVGSASLLNLVINLPVMPGFLKSAAPAFIIQIAFGIFDGILLFGAIFYIVPNTRQRVRDIIPGVLVAAVLMEAFTLLFPLYFKLQHGFSTYGSTFALFFLLLTFAFWLAQITMFGAAVNAERHPAEPGAVPSGQPPPR